MRTRDEKRLRQIICETGQRLYEAGYVVATDGNVSVRVSDAHYLMTPSGCRLDGLNPDDLVLTDGAGAAVNKAQKPTSEWRLHMTCYLMRPDVGAVIHAHPPHALAATLAGVGLTRPVLPEVLVHVGSVPTAPYATPATEESANAVRDYVGIHDAVLMERHGVLTVDETLAGAFMKAERVELLARVLLAVRSAGVLKVLPEDEVHKLLTIRSRLGLHPEAVLPDPSWSARSHED